MWKKCAAAAATAVYIVSAIALGGTAVADPDDPSTDPNSQLCTYPDVNNPYCTQYPDDHDQEGDLGNNHDGGHGRH
ncbi:hypothetical protein ACFVUS_26240 [Nocardia sp. NPDC058058]|uniref:hypothetical protein n=1 Tax=Nocardia sp. NPDC058058 TaxID=3346317 RepID=UPI0036DB8133